MGPLEISTVLSRLMVPQTHLLAFSNYSRHRGVAMLKVAMCSLLACSIVGAESSEDDFRVGSWSHPEGGGGIFIHATPPPPPTLEVEALFHNLEGTFVIGKKAASCDGTCSVRNLTCVEADNVYWYTDDVDTFNSYLDVAMENTQESNPFSDFPLDDFK